MSAHLTDNSKVVLLKIQAANSLFIGLVASKIERRIKTSGKTPLKTGALRADTRAIPKGQYNAEVQMNKEYAAAQEVGHADTREFKNYTTPGSGSGFFREAIDFVKAQEGEIYKTAQTSVGLESE